MRNADPKSEMEKRTRSYRRCIHKHRQAQEVIAEHLIADCRLWSDNPKSEMG